MGQARPEYTNCIPCQRQPKTSVVWTILTINAVLVVDEQDVTHMARIPTRQEHDSIYGEDALSRECMAKVLGHDLGRSIIDVLKPVLLYRLGNGPSKILEEADFLPQAPGRRVK